MDYKKWEETFFLFLLLNTSNFLTVIYWKKNKRHWKVKRKWINSNSKNLKNNMTGYKNVALHFLSYSLALHVVLTSRVPFWYPLLCRQFDILAWRPRRIFRLCGLSIILLLGYISVDYSWSFFLDVSEM